MKEHQANGQQLFSALVITVILYGVTKAIFHAHSCICCSAKLSLRFRSLSCGPNIKELHYIWIWEEEETNTKSKTFFVNKKKRTQTQGLQTSNRRRKLEFLWTMRHVERPQIGTILKFVSDSLLATESNISLPKINTGANCSNEVNACLVYLLHCESPRRILSVCQNV